MISSNRGMEQDKSVLVDVPSFETSTSTKTKVITLKNVVLIALPLIAIVLSIIAIAVAMSARKDHHTSKVNDMNTVHKQNGEDQDIKEVKRNMEVTLADTKSKLSTLENATSDLQKRLTSSVVDIKSKLSDLEIITTNQRETLTSFVSNTTDLRRDINDATSRIKNDDSKLSKLFSVAFHAVVNGDPVINRGNKVKFNLVTLNDGKGYDGSTGVFTVPEGASGLYFLYIHMVTTSGHYATFGLYRNGSQICVFDGDNTQNRDDHDTITCGGVVQLKKGDRVYVELIAR